MSVSLRNGFISFVWLGSMGVHTTSLPVHLLMDIQGVLAIVNTAAVNKKVHVSFESFFCLDICPGVG